MPETPTGNAALVSTFLVEIGGITTSQFKQVTFPPKQRAVIATRAGGDPLHKRTQSGLETEQVITLMYEMQENGAEIIQEFEDWYGGGSADKRSGAVIALDREGNEVNRHSFTNGWLSRIKPPDLDATSEDGTAVYEIDISIATYTIEEG